MSDRQQIRRTRPTAIRSAPSTGRAPRPPTSRRCTRPTPRRCARSAPASAISSAAAYFESLLGSPLSRLFVADGPSGDGAAAAIAVRSDGAIHYYLSGTAEAHRGASPSKNLIVAVTELRREPRPADEPRRRRRGGRLRSSSSSAASPTASFPTGPMRSSAIRRPTRDFRASGTAPATGFFPAYRAP